MSPEVRTLIKTAAVRLRTTSSELISKWAIDNLEIQPSKKKKTSIVSSTDTLT
jgi:hypothetical protein